jgi:hypothetical protein
MQNLPDLFPGSIQLLLAPNPLRRQMTAHLSVQLALQAPMRVLDGGNHFDLRSLARELRRQTRHSHAALGGVYVARAFTCYQMAALLAETSSKPIPTLVPDLLATFQDENVAFEERRRLLSDCLEQLQRLSRKAVLLVSADPQTPELLTPLMAAAGQIWQFELPKSRRQRRLF